MNKPNPNLDEYPTTREQKQLDEFIDEVIDSDDFTAFIREKHFSTGAPISYIDDNNPNVIIIEYPNGRIEREPLED